MGLKDAFNDEVCFAVRGEDGQMAADLQSVAIGEGARKQNGVGLGEVRERVGNLGRRLVKIILAQLLIAGGIDAENENVSLVLKGSVDDDFDDGLGQLHAGSCSHQRRGSARGSQLRLQ